VLVIEDIRDAAETLRDLLEIFGYRVELAFDGLEGLRKVREHRPGVVLCDIGLPGMDGYEVAAELSHNPLTSRIPLVAVTGYGKEEDRHRSLEAGFRAHLTKPVNPEELRLILNQMVRETN
jgi:CheY-like chemotaxis protein